MYHTLFFTLKKRKDENFAQKIDGMFFTEHDNDSFSSTEGISEVREIWDLFQLDFFSLLLYKNNLGKLKAYVVRFHFIFYYYNHSEVLASVVKLSAAFSLLTPSVCVNFLKNEKKDVICLA